MKVYEANCNNEGYELIVTVNGVPLNPRLDLRNHCPDGFACGYAGVGAAQLALALLADHLGDDQQALVVYQQFKWEVIAKLSRSGWHLTSGEIQRVVMTIRHKS